MPTTSLSGWAFHNWGPLTTTYTAPAWCITEMPRNVQLATKAEDHNNSSTLAIVLNTCRASTVTTFASVGDCLPSGSDMDRAYATLDTRNPIARMTIDYFSPGLFCPSGYTTAGVGIKAEGGSITSSGEAFVPKPSSFPSGYVNYFGYNPRPNVLLQALNQSETAVLCCPSAFTVNLAGYCYSELPSYAPSIGCAQRLPEGDADLITETISIFGTTITAGIISYVATSPVTKTFTSTFESPSGWVGVAVTPMITLINNAADVTSAGSQPTASSPANPRTTTLKNGAGLLLYCWMVALTMGVLHISLS